MISDARELIADIDHRIAEDRENTRRRIDLGGPRSASREWSLHRLRCAQLFKAREAVLKAATVLLSSQPLRPLMLPLKIPPQSQ